jgi:hypothetical protein
MPRVVKRSASQAVKFSSSRHDIPLLQFVPPQLSKLVENPPSGAQWVHEIKLDGYAWPHGSTTAARMRPCNGLRGTDARGFNEGIRGM